ncbi:MAG: hypothetical protein A3I29_00780 [Candidatus Magasanikbacteria bacterium RIFCSPLOWO2_02_FULL_44_11]|uniref:Uncharacterized protein n=1 Tax=Candidatus Magasanikbacteria bacterium RIFCSPLOWO2_02_FULL_44_11 TaxID=1798689 RepID=A0A1F6NAB1_9BACT|nr:MAG: hypothetical protein A3I29_00780 [Candidatus Magasanikbacteria bacterium RIFCSPLOWO2_02_FULL_44_11]
MVSKPPLPWEEVLKKMYRYHERIIWLWVTYQPNVRLIPLTRRDRRRVDELALAAERYEKVCGQPLIVGFDVGRVLAQRTMVVGKKKITLQRMSYHRSEPIAEMLKLIRMLVAALDRPRVYVMKGLPPRGTPESGMEGITKYQTNTWSLIFHNLRLLTGFDDNNLVHVSRDRKAEECARHGIKIFVDDRAEVLQHFPDDILPLAYDPYEKEWGKYRRARNIVKVHSADEIFERILAFARQEVQSKVFSAL